MKKKILSVMLAVTLILSFGLMAAPVAAVTPSPPTIDGIVDPGEWDGAPVILTADGVSRVGVIAYTDYLYVLFMVADSTDARVPGENIHGNDQTSININPTPGDTNWGMPCDIIFETSSDLPWNPKDNSGIFDGWNTRWVINDVQLPLPSNLETKTVYYDTGMRISEWKLPLASIAGLSAGDILDVAGTANVGDGKSYGYPPELNVGDVAANWGDLSIFVDILVQAGPAGAATVTTEVVEDIIQITIDPTLFDFGKLRQGECSMPKPVAIDSGSNMDIVVSTSTDSEFYSAALSIGTGEDWNPVNEWSAGIAEGGSLLTNLRVCVPDPWDAGLEEGTIIFWAEEDES